MTWWDTFIPLLVAFCICQSMVTAGNAAANTLGQVIRQAMAESANQLIIFLRAIEEERQEKDNRCEVETGGQE